MLVPCLKCKSCSRIYKGQLENEDSYLFHSLSCNHLEYEYKKDEKADNTTVCCLYCGNRNIFTLGYCRNIKEFICIDCIGCKNMVNSYKEWLLNTSSWTPTILSNGILQVLESTESSRLSGLCISVDDYIQSLNTYALNKLKENLREKPLEINDLMYKVIGSGEKYACVQVIINNRTSIKSCSLISCVSFSVVGNDTLKRVNGIIHVTLGSKLFISLPSVNSCLLPTSGECSLQVYSVDSAVLWYMKACGLLLNTQLVNQSVLQCLLGKMESFAITDAKIGNHDRMLLSSIERGVLDHCLSLNISLIECGNSIVHQAGYFSYIPISPIELAAISGICLQRTRHRQVVFVGTDENLLNQITFLVNSLSSGADDNASLLYCGRLCTADEFKNVPGLRSYDITVHSPKPTNPEWVKLNELVKLKRKMKPEKTFFYHRERIAVMNDYTRSLPYMAITAGKWDELALSKDRIIVVVGGEMMSDVTMSSMLCHVDQVMVFCGVRSSFDIQRNHLYSQLMSRMIASGVRCEELGEEPLQTVMEGTPVVPMEQEDLDEHVPMEQEDLDEHVPTEQEEEIMDRSPTEPVDLPFDSESANCRPSWSHYEPQTMERTSTSSEIATSSVFNREISPSVLTEVGESQVDLPIPTTLLEPMDVPTLASFPSLAISDDDPILGMNRKRSREEDELIDASLYSEVGMAEIPFDLPEEVTELSPMEVPLAATMVSPLVNELDVPVESVEMDQTILSEVGVADSPFDLPEDFTELDPIQIPNLVMQSDSGDVNKKMENKKIIVESIGDKEVKLVKKEMNPLMMSFKRDWPLY